MDQFCKSYDTNFLNDLSTKNKNDIKLLINFLYKYSDRIYPNKQDIFYILYSYLNPTVIYNLKQFESMKYIYENPSVVTIEKFCEHFSTTLIDSKSKKVLFFTVYNEAVKKIKPDISNLTEKDLEYVFDIIDKNYFCFLLRRYLNYIKTNIQFRFKEFGKEEYAGYCDYSDRTFTIDINKNMIIEGFKKYYKQKFGGLYFLTPLSCLIAILQHELTHLIIILYCGDLVKRESFKNTQNHGKMFVDLVNNLFGHTTYTHRLGYVQDRFSIQRQNFGVTKDQLRKNQTIYWKDYKNNIYKGIVIKLNSKTVEVQEEDEKKIKIYYEDVKKFYF